MWKNNLSWCYSKTCLLCGLKTRVCNCSKSSVLLAQHICIYAQLPTHFVHKRSEHLCQSVCCCSSLISPTASAGRALLKGICFAEKKARLFMQTMQRMSGGLIVKFTLNPGLQQLRLGEKSPTATTTEHLLEVGLGAVPPPQKNKENYNTSIKKSSHEDRKGKKKNVVN